MNQTNVEVPMPQAECKSIVLAALDDLKAQNIIDLHVKETSGFTDHLIIASGTSSTHVKALADNILKHVKAHGIRPLSQEGYDSCDWILVDLGDVIVNIMQPRTRDYYHLEGLWGG
jgi:ribosome-associated protein